MQSVTCQECAKVAARSECYSVEGRALCVDCTRAAVERHEEAPMAEGAVVRLSDPSVCVRCQADLDGEEAHPLGDAFLCTACDRALRQRPFPTWLKGAAVFILGMVVVSFAHNVRFIRAQLALKRLERALAAGDIEAAARFATVAQRHVPESDQIAQAARQLGATESLRRAGMLLGEDGQEKTVIAMVEKSLPELPEPYRKDAQVIKILAEQSVAFDRQDYDEFLKKAEEMAKVAPDNPMTLPSRTSALAAKYAATGDESFKTKALEALETYKKSEASKLPGYADFANRIEHRLATREIVARKEFTRRFPQGWKPPEKTQESEK